MGWVNTRPLVCGTPSARSATTYEARFFIEFGLTVISRSEPLSLNLTDRVDMIRASDLWCDMKMQWLKHPYKIAQ